MAARSSVLNFASPLTARPGMCGLFILTGDLLAVIAATAIAVGGRYWLNGNFSLSLYTRLWPVLVLFVAMYAIHGLYPGITFSAVREIRQLTVSTTLVFVMFTALLFLFKQGNSYSRGAFIVAWILALFMLPLTRAWLRAGLAHQPWWGYPVVVFGACDAAYSIVENLRSQPRFGLVPVAVFDDRGGPLKSLPASGRQLPILGEFHEAAEYAQRYGLTRALIAVPDLAGEKLVEMLDLHSESFSHVYIFPEMSGLSSMGMEPRELCNRVTLELRRSLLLRQCQLAKGFLDGSLGLLLSLILAPMMLLIAILIRLESPGKALFRHQRIGHRGREFKVWKFRTMRQNGDEILREHFRKHPEDLKEWELNHKLRRDPRVTPLGRILRKSSLDELPQLWNVLRGEMSLVGPRPIVTEEVKKYGKSYGMYCRVIPGLTGLWQVSGRSQTDYQERVDLDTYYVRNWSPWFDIYLLARTFMVVMKGQGAY